MSKMILIEEAKVKQALEALETHVPNVYKDRGYAPITAIKQALEQPEPEDYPTYDGYIKKALEQLSPPCKTGSQCTSKCEGCAETPVEIGVDVSSEGTHVVGMYVLPDAVRYVFYSQFHPNTSPPQRKPLTDEQKLALCKQFPDHLTFNAIEAIEAKLKEKNT